MRFLPPAVEPYVVAAERGETGGGRRPAARAVVAEYTSAGRIGTGLALWLGVVAALALAVVGAVAVLDAVAGSGSVGMAAAGVVALLAAVAGAALAVARARDLLHAGARLSRAAEAWMTSAPPTDRSVGTAVHGLLSALRPEIFPRVLFSSLSGLGAVLSASAVGYFVWRLAESTDNAVIGALLAVASAAFAVVCAVPAVALWRGARRIQRGLVHDPAATA